MRLCIIRQLDHSWLNANLLCHFFNIPLCCFEMSYAVFNYLNSWSVVGHLILQWRLYLYFYPYSISSLIAYLGVFWWLYKRMKYSTFFLLGMSQSVWFISVFHFWPIQVSLMIILENEIQYIFVIIVQVTVSVIYNSFFFCCSLISTG